MTDSGHRDPARLKTGFIDSLGYWSLGLQALLDRDPGFLAAAHDLASVPARSGVLAPAVKALVQLAVDVTVSRFDREATERSIGVALARGASEAEVLEVCHLTSVLGIQSCVVALPVLVDELSKLGRSAEMGPDTFDQRRDDLKAAFVALRGYWSPLWDDLLRNSPDFFEAYTKFSAYPWTNGTLEPKVREFVYIAIDATTNHLYEPGIRLHIRNALKHGASASEIVEVLEIVSLLGIESSVLGAAALERVAAARRT